jgi:hypothetical protein
MKRTFQLFWQRTWDHLVHLTIINFIWFTLTVPFFLSFRSAVVAIAPLETVAVSAEQEQGPQAAADGSETDDESPATAEVAEAETADIEPDGQAPVESTSETTAVRQEIKLRWGPHVVAPLVLTGMTFLLSSVALGFVFYATADIVAEYDFSGYKAVLRTYLRRGPILKSVAVSTLFLVTMSATLVNMAVYSYLSAAKSSGFSLLAGIMLWFVLFAAMTFSLTLPLVAQRSMSLPRALKTAAIFTLSRPLRMFILMLLTVSIIVISVLSGAGMGFFVVSIPATLFNAEVAARYEEREAAERIQAGSVEE